MTHPIPQELRDRFDEIERDIMGNVLGPHSIFTQMRTAVQSYFTNNPVRPPRCTTCEDHGVIGYTTGQTPESFEQGEAPCPDCLPDLTWEAQGEANQYMLFKDGKWFAAVQMNGELWVAAQEAFFSSIATPHVCLLPPAGWTCTRRAGHSGPCAATEDAPRPQ
jgi:hypothetical protein